MRVMLLVTFPTAKFNALWRAGQVGPKIRQILQDTKPEAVYFGKATGGKRGAILVVDVAAPADLVRFTEPWYLTFEAEVEQYLAMTPEEVGQIDYAAIAKKYA